MSNIGPVYTFTPCIYTLIDCRYAPDQQGVEEMGMEGLQDG